MELEKRMLMMENTYVQVLVDSIHHYEKHGILEKVTQDKKRINMTSGKALSEMMQIQAPDQVFKVLSEIFKCTTWDIEKKDNGFVASASYCKLCAQAKKMKTESPCHIYCLNPMEGMIKGIDATLYYDVKKTLWKDNKCEIHVYK
jgi:formate-dependent phosphoribosylglycinamide formyltransferase (GAR transformylase)